MFLSTLASPGQARNLLGCANANMTYGAFPPCQTFFYGSLMDRKVVQLILNLSEVSTTRPASLLEVLQACCHQVAIASALSTPSRVLNVRFLCPTNRTN
jgi:hypothetical protein